MQTSQVLFLTLVSMLCVCAVLGKSVPDHARYLRERRQYGDFDMSAHQAELALKDLFRKGCKQFACGLVNVHASGKRKRADGYQPESEITGTIDARKMKLLQDILQLLENKS